MGMFGKVRRTAICLRHDLDKVDGFARLEAWSCKIQGFRTDSSMAYIYIYIHTYIYIYIYIYITN